MLYLQPYLTRKRLLDNFFGLDFNYQTNKLATNIIEQENSYKIEISIPGIDKEKIKLNIENDILTVFVEQESSENISKEALSYQEFSRSFQKRSFDISQLDENSIDANYQNGILSIQINKKETSKAKYIAIK